MDGSAVVHRFLDEEWDSDGYDGEWYDEPGAIEPYAEANAVVESLVGEGSAYVGLLADDEVPRKGKYLRCGELRKTLRAEIKRVNALLAETEWQAMQSAEEVGVHLVMAREDRGSRPEALPLEFLERGTELVLRKPGVAVLLRQETGWTTADPNCTNEPELDNLMIDPGTGVGLVQMLSRCVCFGSEAVETHVFRLSPKARKRLTVKG